jgi:transcriptional regulator with XRE-family HTH domain
MRSTADLLRGARHRAQLSQAQVAARAGLPQPTISDYERGRHEPTAPNLERVLRACGQRLVLVDIRPSPQVVSERLSEVLDLAASLPVRPRRAIDVPALPRPS